MNEIEPKESVIDAFSSSIDGVFTGGLPVATFINQLRKSYVGFRDELFLRNIEAFLVSLHNVDRVLLSQTLSNLHREHGEEYFNDALFSAIQKSDSRLRARLYASLLSNCVSGKVSESEFYPILFVLKNIIIQDLNKLHLAIELQRQLNRLQEDEFNKFTKVIETEIGIGTLLRYQSLALARSANVYGGSRVPFINIPFAEMIINATSE